MICLYGRSNPFTKTAKILSLSPYFNASLILPEAFPYDIDGHG